MVKEEKLTPEMWELYRIIKIENSISIPSLVYKMRCFTRTEYDGVINSKYIANSKAYRRLWNMKEAINNSSEVDKIIVIDKGVYRFATKEEAEAYHQKLVATAKDYNERAAFIAKKMRWDGQGKLVNNQYNNLKSTDKQFHETYAEKRNGD